MISIVGGGVAGLCLAAVLEKLNFTNYVVYEHRLESRLDYALTIQQADSVLQFLGIELKGINGLKSMIILDYDMKCLSYNNHSKGNYSVPRSNLISALKNKIPNERIINRKVTKLVETDAGVEVYSRNSKYTNNISYTVYNQVIVADGIRSALRDQLVNNNNLLVNCAQMMVGLIEGDHPLVNSNTVYQIISPIKEDDPNMRTRIFIKPYDKTRSMCQIVGTDMQDVPDIIKKLWVNSTHYENNLVMLKDFEPPESNKILLLGDSLHGMTPYKGQGANVSMHNALILGNMIADGDSSKYYNTVLEKSRHIAKVSNDDFMYIHYDDNMSFGKSVVCKYSPDTLYTSYSYVLGDGLPCSYSISGTQLVRLDLSGLQLKEIPTQVFECVHLRDLVLKDNLIKVIPPKISQLTELKELHIRNNLLDDVPEELFSLSKLKTLRLSYNNLTVLSTDINRLINLQELCLSGNLLTDLPDLNKLTKLKCLYSSNNLLSCLPDLSNMLKLHILRIQWNPLAVDCNLLPPALKELRVSDKQNIINKNGFNTFNKTVFYGKAPTI